MPDTWYREDLPSRWETGVRRQPGDSRDSRTNSHVQPGEHPVSYRSWHHSVASPDLPAIFPQERPHRAHTVGSCYPESACRTYDTRFVEEQRVALTGWQQVCW